MNTIEIITNLYNALIANLKGGTIPVSLRPHAMVGTVQDDPFDSWVGNEIKKVLPNIEIHHADKLTTPDIVLRDRSSTTIVGLEVKKTYSKAKWCRPTGNDY